MTELTELILLVIEDMVCEVHGQGVFNGHILEGENISFSTCCLEFRQQVYDTIYNTINDYHGVSHLNRKIGGGGK